jgi:hypothetical protein
MSICVLLHPAILCRPAKELLSVATAQVQAAVADSLFHSSLSMLAAFYLSG